MPCKAGSVQRLPARHRERLIPRWWVWTLLAGMAAMLGSAYGAALGVGVGWLVGFGCLVMLGSLAWVTSPTIRVDGDGLHAARAVLPVTCISGVRAVSSEEIRVLRGPGADGRVFVTLRPWAATSGVLVSVADPMDPHPAWLLSTRHPEKLAAALTATMAP
jgi:hypothetical protein